MDRQHEHNICKTKRTEDRKDGCVRLELLQSGQNKVDVVAYITFWDAAGQFYFKSDGTEFPMAILKSFIQEAEEAVRTG